MIYEYDFIVNVEIQERKMFTGIPASDIGKLILCHYLYDRSMETEEEQNDSEL